MQVEIIAPPEPQTTLRWTCAAPVGMCPDDFASNPDTWGTLGALLHEWDSVSVRFAGPQGKGLYTRLYAYVRVNETDEDCVLDFVSLEHGKETK